MLTGERYKSITKEAAGVLRGEYGAAPAPFNAELQARVLEGAEPVTCRPADLLAPELERLTAELRSIATDKGFALADEEVDDVLTYALFPQIGLRFLEHRGDPGAFEPVPDGVTGTAGEGSAQPEVYTVAVDGREYVVQVTEGGDVTGIKPIGNAPSAAASAPGSSGGEGAQQKAPLAGNIFKVLVQPGELVEEGDLVLILEAMKMETEIRAISSGVVASVKVKVGDAVSVGDTLLTIG